MYVFVQKYSARNLPACGQIDLPEKYAIIVSLQYRKEIMALWLRVNPLSGI